MKVRFFDRVNETNSCFIKPSDQDITESFYCLLKQSDCIEQTLNKNDYVIDDLGRTFKVLVKICSFGYDKELGQPCNVCTYIISRVYEFQDS